MDFDRYSRYCRYQRKYGGVYSRRPDYDKCAYEVVTSLKWNESHQCNRAHGHGPDGAFCKQHAKKVEVDS